MTMLLNTGQPTISDAKQSGETAPERTLDQVLANIAELAPLVAQCGGEIERERRLSAGLVGALKSARIYGMLVPRRYGGLGLGAPDALRAVSALARLDGSVGWDAMIGRVSSLISFLATRELCDEVFSDGRDHLLAGSDQPTGTAERVPGGWTVTGVWPFASGCQDAEWIAGTCMMMEGGSPILALDGLGPMTRTCLMPVEHWHVHDTWHSLGLRGTGSHDVELRDELVPDRNFFEFPFGASFAPDPIFGMSPELVMLSHGAVAVGIAGIASTCVHVAEGCFELAGSRAVYESSFLQRRMRDLRVAAQHAAVHQRSYVSAGDSALSRLR